VAGEGGSSGAGERTEAEAPGEDGWEAGSPSSSAAALEDLPVGNGYGSTPEREANRRKRISDANRGKVPWNKGRKHSPETLERIRRRTRAALQKPEVREKLRKAALGRRHGSGTKAKIRASRLATVARGKGARDLMREHRKLVKGIWEDVLSIQVRRESLHAERLAERRLRKAKVREAVKGAKSAEHRAKISRAIKAKWESKPFRDKQRKAVSGARAKRARAPAREKEPEREKWQGYEESIRQEALNTRIKRQALMQRHEQMKLEAQELLEEAQAAAAAMDVSSGDSVEARLSNELVRQAQEAVETATASLERLEVNIDDYVADHLNQPDTSPSPPEKS